MESKIIMNKTIYLTSPGFYYCDRFRQFDWLVANGFKPITTKIDDHLRTVWIFDISESLVDCLNRYITDRAQNKTVDYIYVNRLKY